LVSVVSSRGVERRLSDSALQDNVIAQAGQFDDGEPPDGDHGAFAA
jgi:hypothetical protein